MSLRDDILQDLKDRQEWEAKQALWYKFRNGGVKRKSLPYPGAPNQHFPLIDSTIDKHKPAYVQKLYAGEHFVSFVAKKPGKAETASAVAAWFDYKLKQESNYEREAISAIDGLLESGGAPMKVRWDFRRNRLQFVACDPLHIIVPKGTEELKDADRLVHVQVLSVAQYKANKHYNKDPDFIKRIKGKGVQDGDSGGTGQTVDEREGITHGKENDIVVWEIFDRDPNNWDRIIIKTRSPLLDDDDSANHIRPDFQMPFTEGIFKEGAIPFVKWRPEITRKGYYAPRGIAEIQAPFETSLNKTWNFKHEWMDFFSRPMFKQTGDLGSTNNFKTHPGAIVPNGLEPVDPPQIPPAFNEEMNMTRQMAEYRVQAPDFGVMSDQGGKRTATEISAISGQTGQGTDLRSRVFGLDTGDTYKMAWALQLQYGKDSLDYILHGDAKTLDATALEDCYQLTPNGSADAWNKGARAAKAYARYDRLKGSPYIKQGELTKTLLEDDEPGLVPRLFQDPQDQQAGEMEEQAMEIITMLHGFPAAVDPTDDDKAHLMSMRGFIDRRMQTGEGIMPELARLLLAHGAAHDQAMQGKKDPELKAFRQQMMPAIQLLSQIAAQPDPREMQNVVSMQQGDGSVPPQASASGPAPVALSSPAEAVV